MPQLTSRIADEVAEIMCETLELETFEITSARPLTEHYGADNHRAIEVLLTLQCAFGMTIDHADPVRMQTLDGMVDLVLDALSAKRAAQFVQVHGLSSGRS